MDLPRWSSLLAHWQGGSGPLYTRLGGALSSGIQAGLLRPGERLPSERRLADLAQVSRSTVVAAYDELSGAGWVQRRQGSGTFVASTAPRQGEVLALRSPVHGNPRSGPAQAPLAPGEDLDLSIAHPTLGPVQQARLAQASAGAFSESLYHPLGLPELRALLAAEYTRTGLPTRAEQVIVTTGAQQAIALIAGALLRPGDTALLETPTYFGAIDVFRAAGARLQGVRVDGDGLDWAGLGRALEAGPRLAFFTPTCQNPTGTVMPTHTRERLARLLAGRHLPTIEDDTLLDLGFTDTAVLPRLATFDADAPVICVGSLSKLFWAGLRVGWMRVPVSLGAQLAQHKTLADFGSSVPSQHLALHLLRDLPGLRAERRAAVRPARDLLARLLREHLPGWHFTLPAGGQFLWAHLPTRNAAGFTQTARRHRVRVFPGALMDVGDLPDSFLRLPFTLPPEVLPEAVLRLARAWAAFQEREGERLA